jgi:hypothetical protein
MAYKSDTDKHRKRGDLDKNTNLTHCKGNKGISRGRRKKITNETNGRRNRERKLKYCKASGFLCLLYKNE